MLGVEFCNRLTVSGFAGLQLLSATAARPCDRERDGLVLGEALAAVLVSAAPAPWRIAALATGMDAASITAKKPRRKVAIPAKDEVDLECAWRDSNPQPSDP